MHTSALCLWNAFFCRMYHVVVSWCHAFLYFSLDMTKTRKENKRDVANMCSSCRKRHKVRHLLPGQYVQMGQQSGISMAVRSCKWARRAVVRGELGWPVFAIGDKSDNDNIYKRRGMSFSLDGCALLLCFQS